MAVLDFRTKKELAYLSVGDHPQRIRHGFVSNAVLRSRLSPHAFAGDPSHVVAGVTKSRRRRTSARPRSNRLRSCRTPRLGRECGPELDDVVGRLDDLQPGPRASTGPGSPAPAGCAGARCARRSRCHRRRRPSSASASAPPARRPAARRGGGGRSTRRTTRTRRGTAGGRTGAHGRQCLVRRTNGISRTELSIVSV